MDKNQQKQNTGPQYNPHSAPQKQQKQQQEKQQRQQKDDNCCQ
jgi:hypothetical protein